MNAHEIAAKIVRLQDLASRLNRDLIQVHDEIDAMRGELQTKMDVTSAALSEREFIALIARITLLQDEVVSKKIWREQQEKLMALKKLRPDLVPL